MNICDNKHDEIVFYGMRGVHCPLCSAESRIMELEDDLNTLQEEIDELKKRQV